MKMGQGRVDEAFLMLDRSGVVYNNDLVILLVGVGYKGLVVYEVPDAKDPTSIRLLVISWKAHISCNTV